jgi:hypothetical protein
MNNEVTRRKFIKYTGLTAGGGLLLGPSFINSGSSVKHDNGFRTTRDAEDVALRPRVVILSDFPPLDVIPGGAGYGPPEKRSDTDDIQSMIRFLLYSNDLEVEGLVASAATMANIADKKGILDLLLLYNRVEDNLRKHDARFPTASHLQNVTWNGQSNSYAKPAGEIIGARKDSEASEAIISLIDRPESRPVWFCVWGGSCDLAQAIWKVHNTRSSADTEKFISKIRVYLISLQDGSGQWLLDTFPHLFIIYSANNWRGMKYNSSGSDSKLGDLDWLNKNVRRGNGILGLVYPESDWNNEHPGVGEGDSPSFLHLVSGVRGINDPEKPEQPGWGGQFVQLDSTRNHWTDHPDGQKTVWRWRQQVQDEFVNRMKWCVD